MLALSKARCADHPWVAFLAADATRLPFPDGDFEAAVSTQVYEYVADLTTALAELHRVLRPGGCALTSTPIGVPSCGTRRTARA